MRYILLLVASLTCVGELHACYASVPEHMFVERARIIAHLKVVRIEDVAKPLPGGDDDFPVYSSNYAVCEVQELLLGVLLKDSDGCVRLQTHADRGARFSTSVSYKVGQEVTILRDDYSLLPGLGMLFSGGGHPGSRPCGAPSSLLRKLLKQRSDRTTALLATLSPTLRTAASEARRALESRRAGDSSDLLVLSPEADLLADLVAFEMGEPALAKCDRPELDSSIRLHLVELALCEIFGFEANHANQISPLFTGTGHGLDAMMVVTKEKKDLKKRCVENVGMSQLLRLCGYVHRISHDGPPLEWLVALIEVGGDTTTQAGSLCVQMLCSQQVRTDSLLSCLNCERSARYPYSDGESLAMARILDTGATQLFLLLVSWGKGIDDAHVDSRTANGSEVIRERAIRLERALNSDECVMMMLDLAIAAELAADESAKRQEWFRLAAAHNSEAVKACGQKVELDSLAKVVAYARDVRRCEIPAELTLALNALDTKTPAAQSE